MTQHSKEYRAVIKSREWRERRQRLIGERQGCEKCLLITEELEVHHKHYETLGCENDSDLEVLCKACHKEADTERQRQVRLNQYYDRVAAWAAKKYGDDWEDDRDWVDVRDEFEAWLARNRR